MVNLMEKKKETQSVVFHYKKWAIIIIVTSVITAVSGFTYLFINFPINDRELLASLLALITVGVPVLIFLILKKIIKKN